MITINEQRNFEKANNLFDKLSPNKKNTGGNSIEYIKKLTNKSLGIIKENSLYTIKISDKKSGNLVAEDFSYINGYEDRKRFQRKTLQEAIKYLHLFLNEDQYVLDVPVPTPPPTPEPEIPQIDNPMDTPVGVDGEDVAQNDGVDGENMDGQPAENDDQKEMQKLTGTLAQDLRQEIEGGNEEFTVGMFKSILAAAKNLSPENKTEVMDKAQEVLSAEEETDQTNNQEPAAPDQNQGQMDNGLSESTDKFQADYLKHIRGLENVKSPEVVLEELIADYADLNPNIDYKPFVDSTSCGIRFMTAENGGKFDLFIFYFSTVVPGVEEKKGKIYRQDFMGNYDIYVVQQTNIKSFLHSINNYAKARPFAEHAIRDAHIEDLDAKIKQFLLDPHKQKNGVFAISNKKLKADAEDSKVEESASIFTTKKKLFESLDVSEEKARKHFNSGGDLEIRSYKKGKKVTINKERISKMFNVPIEQVNFDDVIEYGYNDEHYPDKGYRIV